MGQIVSTLIVAVLAGIVWTGPPLTPEQAARVLRESPAISNRTEAVYTPPPSGPTFVIVGDRVPWTVPASPARRLDGTSLEQPVQNYGVMPWLVFGSSDHGHRLPSRPPIRPKS